MTFPLSLSLRRASLFSMLVFGFIGCGKKEAAPESSTLKTPVDRGRYLVDVGGCANCHSPVHPGPGAPPDMSRYMSGHPAHEQMGTPPALSNGWALASSADNTAFAGPWGVTFASNLTPDSATGIGTWDEGRFIQVLHGGMHVPDLRPIQPPMNVQSFRSLSDDDLKAMFAYLRTLQPVANKVPDYIPASGLSRLGTPGTPQGTSSPDGAMLPPGAAGVPQGAPSGVPQGAPQGVPQGAPPGIPPGAQPVAPTVTRR